MQLKKGLQNNLLVTTAFLWFNSCGSNVPLGASVDSLYRGEEEVTKSCQDPEACWEDCDVSDRGFFLHSFGNPVTLVVASTASVLQ